jgi:hypothetical protein
MNRKKGKVTSQTAAVNRTEQTSSPTPDDPRALPDFQPAFFPLCDGADAPPPGTTNPTARRKIEFLAAYYRLNQLHARLQAIRREPSTGDKHSLLREIQFAIRDRDNVEDKYEPEGFLGEPVMEGPFYTNIKFTHARSRQFYRPLASSRFSIRIPVPPPDVEVEAWVERHLAAEFPEFGVVSSLKSTTDRLPKKTSKKTATPKKKAPGGRPRPPEASGRAQ